MNTQTALYRLDGLSKAFNAPIYYTEQTESTMLDARILAGQNVKAGTCIYAGNQIAGRGRIQGRIWKNTKNQDLLCTLLLKASIIPGFTLRIGLAVAKTFEHFLPEDIHLHIKWPNDVLYKGKKLSGILCESAQPFLYVGTGLNIGQKEFPHELQNTASSLALLLPENSPMPSLIDILNVYLTEVKIVLENSHWHTEVSSRLFKKGEEVEFLLGDPTSSNRLRGSIQGIGPSGELLLVETKSQKLQSYFSGEISMAKN